MEINVNRVSGISNQASHVQSQDIIDKAKAGLIGLLERAQGPVTPEAINFLGLEFVTWPNGALGCPEPNKSYTQACVPGYKIQFQHQGRVYHVHTDARGSHFVSPDIKKLAILAPQPAKAPSIFELSRDSQ